MLKLFLACNNFGLIIFNMEDFANKDIRVKRRGLTNFIALYGYYKHYIICSWFSSSDWSSCALFWDDELLITMVVVSLLVLLLSMDTSLFCLFPFKVLSPKLQRIGNFFGCSMYGNVFLVCCFTKHRAPTAKFSFFLSKNVTYFFFESMITLLYQPLCCGSPMGTMNFSMCNGIWLTEFSQSFAYKFISIIAIWKVFGIQTWKCILQRLYNLLTCFGP